MPIHHDDGDPFPWALPLQAAEDPDAPEAWMLRDARHIVVEVGLSRRQALAACEAINGYQKLVATCRRLCAAFQQERALTPHVRALCDALGVDA